MAHKLGDVFGLDIDPDIEVSTQAPQPIMISEPTDDLADILSPDRFSFEERVVTLDGEAYGFAPEETSLPEAITLPLVSTSAEEGIDETQEDSFAFNVQQTPYMVVDSLPNLLEGVQTDPLAELLQSSGLESAISNVVTIDNVLSIEETEEDNNIGYVDPAIFA